MIPRFLPLPLLLPLVLALPAQAQSTYVGLPETGTVDDGKVTASRYGAEGSASGSAPAPARRITGGITGVFVESTAKEAQERVPVTFGQVFAPGDVKASDRLVGRLADGRALPLQVDAKARHPDGSLRHAVVSAIVPKLAPGESLMLAIAKEADGKPAAARAISPAELLAQGFQAGVTVRLDGREWSASAARLLAGKQVKAWLAGPLAGEWLVSAPLVDARGEAHPHLAARFAIRWYPQARQARVDVTVENDWAYEPGPRNFTYDAAVSVGGKEVYAQSALVHYHHARWRKVFWWGGDGAAPALHLRYDTPYLIASRALPNYDQSVRVSGAALAEMGSRWNGKNVEPMGTGLTTAYMPMTGGRNDIGLLPGWAAMYLLSMDARAARATYGSADLAGSFSMHYRDKRTGDPVSLVDYPYMTMLGHPGDTFNPATGKREEFPGCAAPDACKTPYTHDIAHQPNLAYLPYLLSGDRYYLDELLFWASYDVFASNPGYRDNVKGLLRPEQVRGQAWALRTLAEAAYIAPDNERLKGHLAGILDHNLAWYNKTYTDNPQANRLGAIVNGYALGYRNGTGLAPWQDDFFTAAVGHAAELGFPQARRLLAWKARFPIARMTAPGACWIDAAAYEMVVKKSAEGPFLDSMADVYAATHTPEVRALPCGGSEMAAAFKLRPGEMTGFANGAMGYPSNMQPALAFAADVGGEAGKKAWRQFMARSVKPDYSAAPQFAIVPRSAAGDEERAPAP
ncbi:hypothetical protein [Massilia sp. TN1-12]|uniref:RIFT barrel domain-containing protein n=1 Tax=Massilia paldalensis TaxID=3377675 RepID=UPI00384CC702